MPTDYYLLKKFQNFLAGRIFSTKNHAKTPIVEFVASQPPGFFGFAFLRFADMDEWILRDIEDH